MADMQRWRTLLTLLVAGILSGCVGPPEATTDPTTSPSPVDMHRWLPGIPFPPLPVNEGLRTFVQEECTGYAAGANVPQSGIRAATPSAFEPEGSVPGTYRLSLFFAQCARMVVGDQVFEDVSTLLLAPRAKARESEWDPEGLSLYTLDAFVSSAAAGTALRTIGQPYETAIFSTFAPTLQDHEAWAVAAANGTVRFEYEKGTGAVVGRDSVVHHWTGAGPFLRSTERLHAEIRQSTGVGFLEFQGSLDSAAAATLPRHRIEGTPLVEFTARVVVDAKLYGEHQ